MSVLTLLTLVVIALGAFTRFGYARALAVGGVTSAGSAITVGTTALPTFYAVCLGLAVAFALMLLRTTRSTSSQRRPPPPGVALLLLFLAWSALVTLLAPLFFDGLLTVTPDNAILRAGVLTTSNVAQIAYLALGILVVVFVARTSAAAPALVGIVVGTCTMLSFWRYLNLNLGLPFPLGVFDNSPSFEYIETAAGGLERFRGILSEPSSLAGTSLITIAYMLPRAAALSGWRRAGALSVAGIALYLGIISTAATFVVAGLITVALIGGAGLVGFLSSRYSLNLALGLVVCVAVVGALLLLPVVLSFVTATINDKLGSSSYADRSSADGDSITIFLDTYGFGVGLGAARGSSFLPTVLSATGLVGTLLLVAAIGTLLRRGSALPAYRPIVWAMVTVLVVKLTAGPDLSDYSGVFWISLGLLSRSVLEQRRTTIRAPSPGPGRGSPVPLGPVT